MIWRDDSARASPAGLPSFAQKNGHSLTRGSRRGSHARNAPQLLTRAPATTLFRHTARRSAACERARKFRRRERAGQPTAVVVCRSGIVSEGAR
jgi:hypothetical protein